MIYASKFNLCKGTMGSLQASIIPPTWESKENTKSGKTDCFHVEDWLKSLNRGDLRADFHKLRYWGLLKKKIHTREDGSPRN